MAQKVFRDAVHNMISLELDDTNAAPWEYGDALLLTLIDAPEMQRLRRISQLGFASHIYPCAEHSRFSHALGVMHLAKRILMLLMTRHPGLISREMALHIKAAALLHDVGHGPFSHVFEEIYPHAPRHEEWGRQIVLRPQGLSEKIRQFAEARQQNGEPLLAGIATLLASPPPTGAAIGRQIIASQLDADRMDYLLRDAHFTGVDYGRYDLEWLLHSLRVGEVAGVPRLCVDITKGPSALESYMTARNHMYRQVYDHKTVRAFEILLTLLFRTILDYWQRKDTPPPATPPVLERFIAAALAGNIPAVEDFLALDDTVILYALGEWAALDPQGDPLLRDLVWKSRLLRHRQPVYRRLRWRLARGGEITDGIQEPEFFHALAAFFDAEGATPLPLQDPTGGELTLPVRLLVMVDKLERTPYAHLQYHGGQGEEPIYVVQSANRVVAAEQASSHMDFLGRSRWQMARVFVDPRAETAVRQLVHHRFHHPWATLADQEGSR